LPTQVILAMRAKRLANKPQEPMSKVLIPIGDAAEAMDTLYPYFRVREEGYEAVVAGPDARVYPLVMHEIPPGWDITRESASYHLASEIAFRDVNPEDYQGLFLT